MDSLAGIQVQETGDEKVSLFNSSYCFLQYSAFFDSDIVN